MFGLFNKQQEILFEKSYKATPEAIWEAWTNPEIVKTWWGPRTTIIPECRIDPKVGGELFIVMEGGEGMGSYKGMRWPLQGTFTTFEPYTTFTYTAKGWTEGEENSSTIDQQGVLTLEKSGDMTIMKLKVTLLKTGIGAKMAAFGLKMGYNEQFERLGERVGRKE